jgi:CRISPR-associated protein Cas1
MSTLYVTETGVQVHKEGQRLLVKKGREVLQDIPMIKVDRVVLMGKGASITTPTLYALTQRKVGVYYLSSRGKFILRTAGADHKHSRLRQAQIRACDNPESSMAIAQAIVRGKVSNQRVLVQRHAEGATWARNALAQMDAMRRHVDAAGNLDELRGREGLAAKEYFHLMRQLLRPPSDGRTWGFERRAYYPPTDPINALLSFGYTLLLNDMVAACQISGLDPDIGFFHAVDYNKPAMALDLEEEFRPIIVDSILLAAINRPIFRLSDFEIGQPWKRNQDDEDDAGSPVAQSLEKGNSADAPRPIYLREAARKRFISLYETRVNEQIFYPPTGEQTSYRRIFELQAYAMARVILGENPHYLAFTVR